MGWMLLARCLHTISYTSHMYLSRMVSCRQVIMSLCTAILPPTQVSGSIHACLQSQQTNHHQSLALVQHTRLS